MIAFEPDMRMVKVAREHVAGIAAGWPVDAYEVSVVASELVTNAVLHAKTDEIRVDACADGGVYVLKVWDADETLPVACRPGADVVGGRVLMIVEELAAPRGRGAGRRGRQGRFRRVGRFVNRRRRVVRAVSRWRLVLEARTLGGGHDAAVRRLEVLRVALGPLGWRCVGLYDRREFRFPVPLPWVYACGVTQDVGAAVTVRALPGGEWGYFEAGDRRSGFVWPCGEAEAAASALDLILKHRMSPCQELV